MAERRESAAAPRRVALSAVADTALILVFVALGRRNHDSSTGLLEVAAPFLLGATVGWLAGRVWRRPFDLRSGLVVWVATVAVGMVLRWGVWDRGVALSFVIVATLVTGAFVNGWRVLARAAAQRGTAATTSS